MRQWSSVYLYDDSASAYIDLTFDAQDFPGSEPDLMAEESDYLYYGLDRSFTGVFMDISGGSGDYTEVPEYSYYNGSEWQRLPIQNNYNFRDAGVLRFVEPPNWSRALLSDAESQGTTGLKAEDDDGGTEKYWIKVKGSDVSSPAKLIQSFPFPSYSLTTPEECRDLMLLRISFDENTKPTWEQVEQVIKRVEGRIEGYSLHSWKPQYRENEVYDYGNYGFVLKRYPVIRFFDLKFWNGQAFEPLTEGRQHDYFIDKKTGIIEFSRFIHLPFAYRRVRSYGFGQFNRSLQASYVWGKDELDERYYMAKDIATKLTTADLLSSYDFTTMIPQGTDRFSLDQRIEQWRESAEERLEELRSLRTWVP